MPAQRRSTRTGRASPPRRRASVWVTALGEGRYRLEGPEGDATVSRRVAVSICGETRVLAAEGELPKKDGRVSETRAVLFGLRKRGRS